MDLRLCPQCNAFVGNDWSQCRACGAALGISPESPAEPSVETPLTSEEESPDVQESPEPVSTSIDDLNPSEISTPMDLPSDAVRTPESEVVEDDQESGWGPEPEFTFPAPESDSEERKWVLPEWATVEFKPVEPTPQPEVAETQLQAVQLEPQEDSAADTNSITPSPQFALDTKPQSSAQRISKIVALVVATFTIFLVVSITAISVIGTPSKTASSTKTHAATTTTTIGTVTTKVPPAGVWRTYTDPQNRFKVDLPSEPQITQRPFDGTTVSSLTSTTKDGLIVVTVASIPGGADWSQNDGALKSVLQSEAGAANAKVTSSITQTISGHKEVDAHLVGTEVVYDVRYFAQGNTFCEIWQQTKGSSSDPDTFSRVAETLTVSSN